VGTTKKSVATDLPYVVLEEGAPRRGGRPVPSDHVSPHGRWRELDPDLRQLAYDAGRSPERVGGRHVANQVTHFPRGGWPPGLPRSAQPRPIVPELPSSPGDHGLGLHEDQGFAPSGPRSGEPSPKHPVRGFQSWSGAGPLVDAELVPERQDLDLHGEPGTEEVLDEGEEAL
jgi:hypothetical protein